MALAGAGLATLPLAAPAPAQGRSPELAFLAVGDWGKPEKRDAAMAVANRMGEVADSLHARFVISTGDNFYPSGVTGVGDSKWVSAFEEVYRAKSLACPWYPVLGNHDRDGNAEAQIKYSAHSPRWRMEAPYYQRSEPLGDGGHADFFFLDTEAIDDQGLVSRWVRRQPTVQRQLDWLDEGLSKSRARWKVVVGHHTIFSGGHHGNTAELQEDVRPLLERHGVQAYINGHDHDLQHVLVNGVNYLTTGAGAETRPTGPIKGTLFATAQLGFMSARVKANEMAIAFVGTDGREMYAAMIPGGA